MKTSVVFLVGFFLFGCVGAGLQDDIKHIGEVIFNAEMSAEKFKLGILKKIRNDIVAVLPIEEAKEYYEQLKNSPQWKAFKDLISGKDLQKILERIHETPAFKLLVDYHDKIIKCYEMILKSVLSQARNVAAR